MSKETNKLTPENMLYKYPTLSGFQKAIEPLIKSKKIFTDIRPKAPVLPEYLKEMAVTINPYTEIKASRIKELKALEKCRKDYELKMYTSFPIVETVSRDVRIKFNARYQTKKLKYDLNLKEQFEQSDEFNFNKDVVKPRAVKLPVAKSPIEIPRSKFVSNKDFIVNKRQICMFDLAINIKEEQFSKLEEIVRNEEEFIANENKRIQKENEAHDNYLKMICQNTSDAIKLAEKEILKRNMVYDRVKLARYNMAHMNAECVKLEEEYLKLKTYKEFLRNCHKQRERKQAMERTSLMNELKIDAILKDIETDRMQDSEDSMIEDNEKYKTISSANFNFHNSSAGEATNNQNLSKFVSLLNENNNTSENLGKPRTLMFNKDQLEKLKAMILLGFSNSNQEEYDDISSVITTAQSTEVDSEDRHQDLDPADLNDDEVFFDEPQDLVNVLSELEANNLSLIENVQEQEEMCDQMKQRIEHIKSEMKHQISAINKHIFIEKGKIANLEDSISCIQNTEKFLDTFYDLERYRKLFFLEDMLAKTPDQVMDYIHEKVMILYHSVFEKIDSSKSNTLEMVKKIEILVDALYVELQSHDRTLIIKAKKIVDERKREAARMRQKQNCFEAEQLKIQKAMANAVLGPKYRYGRKVVYRSDPFKEVSKIVKVDSDVIRNQEETAFFFT